MPGGRGQQHRRTPLAAVGMLVALAWQASAPACPYAIRDAGFIARDPRPYRLCVLVANGTPGRDKLATWLKAASERHLGEANVKAELVNVDTQPTHPAAAHLATLADRGLPAAVLLSPAHEALALGPLGRGAPTPKAVEALVARAVSSPRRDDMLHDLVDPWCVVVLAKGTASDRGNARAQKAIEAAIQQTKGTVTAMGRTIARPPHLMILAADDRDEPILIWALALDQGGCTQPRAAIVFGAGRRLGPVLEGREIDQATLLGLFQFLGRNCTCTADPESVLGPQVPLVWGADVQSRVAKALGFDPNSPRSASTLAGVWKSVALPRLPDLDTLGYSEGIVEFGPEPTADESQRQESLPAPEPKVPRPERAPAAPDELGLPTSRPGLPDVPEAAPGRRLGTAVWLVVAGLVIVALGGSAALWLARRHHAA